MITMEEQQAKHEQQVTRQVLQLAAGALEPVHGLQGHFFETRTYLTKYAWDEKGKLCKHGEPEMEWQGLTGAIRRGIWISVPDAEYDSSEELVMSAINSYLGEPNLSWNESWDLLLWLEAEFNWEEIRQLLLVAADQFPEVR